MIIGIHDADKLTPILEVTNIDNRAAKFKTAVGKLLDQNFGECESLLSNCNNFVYVLSELIKQELIEIRIAAPKSDYKYYEINNTWPVYDNTFHPKISIFMDDSETVIMTGSINSTKSGYGKNIEEASFRNSWEDRESTQQYEKKFSDIWNGEDNDSHIFLFNDELKNIVKEVIEKSTTYKREYKKITAPMFRFNHFLDLIAGPLFYHYSFNNIRLLPHQIGVYNKMLSRWPVKGLISDEVGLGKTIESGAILKYMATFLNASNNCILVPSSLKYQWQSELYDLFGLKFYVYENATSSLVFKPHSKEINNVMWYDCFQHEENIIYSWHFLRSKDSTKFTSDIDLLLVDEAHNARITYRNSQETPTLLFLFLQSLKERAKHLIFLSATPLQTGILDYVSIISLLQDKQIDENSMNRIIDLNNELELSESDKVAAVEEMQEAGLEKYQGITNAFEMLQLYNENDYIDYHPTTKLTIRNTRNSLKSIGYQDFPQVLLSANPISCAEQQERIFNLVTNYAVNQLFKIERVALGLKTISFVRSMYQQRIASSFNASFDTLTNRKLILQQYINDGYIEFKVDNEGDIDELEDIEIITERIELTEDHITHIKSEMDSIREILTELNEVIVNKTLDDPKIIRTLEIIEEHKVKNRSILVFSRYTSTTNYIIDLLKEKNETFGVFQGNRKQVIRSNGDEISYDKTQLSKKFNDKEFTLLICSDAASEGLNLQIANVLINVDVPWNPAKLLQRFGRIDRFGQQNPEIYFYNLVYQESIEHRIYKKLIGRNNLFRSILGVTPDITDEAHIDNINDLSGEDDIININRDSKYRNSLLKLTADNNIRIHEKILSRLRQNQNIEVSESNISIGNVSLKFSDNFLDGNYLDLHHPILKEIDVQFEGTKVPIVSINNTPGYLMLYCLKYEDAIYPITNIEEYLDYFIVGKQFNLDSLIGYNLNELDQLIRDVLKSDDFINHASIISPENNESLSFYNNLRLDETNLIAYCNI
ncbi:hypothetical protein HN510_01850 [Candidatus Woesearchaeota archaeon]|nr:hypothetical protein [Candidatus Woesearchaeota archaeon]